MKTEDAARKLNCTIGNVRTLLRQKKLKGTKVGPRLWDVDHRSVEEYLQPFIVSQPESQVQTTGELMGSPALDAHGQQLPRHDATIP